MLEFRNVSFTYPGEREEMIKNLSFRVEKGAFVAIVGASGCGKSTIFRLINGLETPVEGEILFDGEPVHPGRRISAYMPQKDLLLPWRTILKNLCLPMELAGIPKKEQEARAEALLKEVGLLKYRDKYPKELSGGMKQRASFARTLLSGAELLLLDEPFSALDALTRMGLCEWLLAEWEKHPRTILFITHDVEEAVFLSQRVYGITERPIRGFTIETVPLAYPRARRELFGPEMTALKERLVERLRQRVEE